MRLDKFLKNSRLIKRRPLAKKVADEGRIQVNDQTAKAATNVEEGDIIRIQFGQTIVTARVLKTLDVVRKNDAELMYEVINEERVATEE
ncbi:MAG TPA: RNA-binding S4 domain-containing protein [Bacillota bacterium]|nr:RNA-binding S4 domain-containing protein [Bacillota bacterium]